MRLKNALLLTSTIGILSPISLNICCCNIAKTIDQSVLCVSNFSQLKSSIENQARQGVYDSKTIVIDQDIVCNETIYVMNDTTIICNESHSITRGSNFLDDLFVVGEDENGNNPIVSGDKAILTLKTGSDEAILTIDGNKDNITDEIYGSAIFISNCSQVNLNKNVKIQNFRKDKNSRTLSKRSNQPIKAGGAAVIVTSGTFNMYDGLIDNCICPAEDSSEDKAYMGGAIFSDSGFNMYGGTISNCSAARGGAIYNYSTCRLVSGTIDSCSCSKYGGAIYLPDIQYSNLILGSTGESESKMILKNNNSGASGGSIFGQHHSVIYSMGNCEFESNIAKNNGGAINSSGSVVIDNTIFKSNTAITDKSKGGAVYVYTDTLDLPPREPEFNGCEFNSNTSVYSGGAITFDAGDETYPGSIGKISNCSFTSNSSAKGGAICNQGDSKLTIGDSEFTQNEATGEYGGGAIYATETSNTIINDIDVINNKATVGNGGAIYLTGGSTTIVNNLTATGNTSEGNGGAIYLTSESTATIDGLTASNNTTTGNGGAIYLTGSSNTTIGEATFTSNTATGNGGAIYITTSAYTVADTIVATNNSATGGGAIYVTGSSNTTIGVANFANNTATKNGGAIYAYTSANITFDDLTATNNTAVNGGAIYASGESNTVINRVTASSNIATKSGGFVYVTVANTIFCIKSGEALNNISRKASPSGSTLWCNSADSSVKIKGTTTKEYFNFDGDISGVEGFEVQEYEE